MRRVCNYENAHNVRSMRCHFSFIRTRRERCEDKAKPRHPVGKMTKPNNKKKCNYQIAALE